METLKEKNKEKENTLIMSLTRMVEWIFKLCSKMNLEHKIIGG
jgi:hypothetical protein